MNDDNTVTASTYPWVVHYENSEGELVDIDNTMESSEDSELGEVLENKDNSIEIKFSKKAKEKNMVKLTYEGHKISWGMVSANKNKNVKDQTQRRFNLTNDPQYLNNISSTVTYGEIRPNVDLYYDVIGMSLKERIVLKSAEAERNFTFQFSTKDLTMSKDEDRILFRSLDGTEVFCMDPLMMYDALGNESPAIDITLECTKDNQNNHEYLLTITPSDQWLDNPERVFPVTIDPSIQTTQNPSSVMDTYISSGSPNYSSYYNWGWFKVGTNGSTVNKALIYFHLPEAIKFSDRVIHAELYAAPYLGENSSLFTQLESSKGAPLWKLMRLRVLGAIRQ